MLTPLISPISFGTVDRLYHDVLHSQNIPTQRFGVSSRTTALLDSVY